MDIEVLLNSFDAILILGVMIPTFVMATRIRQGKLRLLTSLLAGFLIFHGLYHLSAALVTFPGFDPLGPLSDLVFEPLSWLLFLGFAIYIARYRL